MNFFETLLGPRQRRFGGTPPIMPQYDDAGMSSNGRFSQSYDMPQLQVDVPDVSQPPKQRRSLLDTVGGIADVFARVGGAEALYQPTLDARLARDNAQVDRSREIDLDEMRKQLLEQQIGAGEIDATQGQNKLASSAIRGLQAIQRGGGDVNAAWPLLARQAGISDERAAELGKLFASNPNALEGVAAMFDQSEGGQYGMEPIPVRGADGKTRLYQLNKRGGASPISFGEGEEPLGTTKFVDAGGQMVGVDSYSNKPRTIITRSERPGAVETRNQRGQIAAANTASRERIAATRVQAQKEAAQARAAGKSKGGSQEGYSGAIASLNELDKLYDEMNKAGAAVNPNNSAGRNIIARIGTSAIGQAVGGAVGSQNQTRLDRVNSIRPELLLSMANALGLSATQINSNVELKEHMKTISDPTASYQANKAATAGLRRILGGTLNTQPTAGKPGNVAPRRTSPAPAASGWGKATIVRGN
jgi:hypothetical protein